MTMKRINITDVEDEYKARIKDWADRLGVSIAFITQYLYPDLVKVIKEMKEVNKEIWP